MYFLLFFIPVFPARLAFPVFSYVRPAKWSSHYYQSIRRDVFVSRDVKVVTGFEYKKFDLLQIECLRYPEARQPIRRKLGRTIVLLELPPLRYDPFDPEATVFENSLKNFSPAWIRKFLERFFISMMQITYHTSI